jgi:hypothetical protein
VDAPHPGGTDTFIYGVSALAADDAWAVGWTGLLYTKTFILHWDGTRWRIVPSPNPSNGFNQLHAVAAIAPDDVWAVGSASADTEQALILHWNGRSWRVVRGAVLGEGTHRLNGVSGTASDDVWIAGHRTNGHDAVTQSLTEHWDGAKWEAVQAVHHQPNPNVLTGVTAVAPEFALATGYRKWGSRTLALVWDGADWSIATSEQVTNTTNVLNDISADVAGNAWTVGYYYIPGDGQAQTLIEQWDGASWHIVPSPNEGAGSSLEGVVTLSAEEAWAVGAGGNSFALIERYCAAGS